MPEINTILQPTHHGSHAAGMMMATNPSRAKPLRSEPINWALAALALITTLLLQSSAHAQTQNIELILAERLLIQPNKQTPIAIQIEPNEPLPNGAFVRMRGLPTNATLNQGYRVNKSGTWAVPIKSLRQLRITIPQQIENPVPVKVQLTTLSGEIFAERQTTLIMGPSPLAPPQLASKQQKSASEARQRAADVIAATSTLAVGEKKQDNTNTASSTTQTTAPVAANSASSPAQRLLQRGHSFLLDGNISIARQFYQRSAKLGLATAAIAMASTYDPNELPKLGLVDLPGSKYDARKWYERAKEMGSPVAQDRLQRLSAE